VCGEGGGALRNWAALGGRLGLAFVVVDLAAVCRASTSAQPVGSTQQSGPNRATASARHPPLSELVLPVVDDVGGADQQRAALPELGAREEQPEEGDRLDALAQALCVGGCTGSGWGALG